MEQYLKRVNKIQLITKIAMLMALTLVAKAFFYFFPVVYGYSIEFYLVVYIYGMLALKNGSSKLCFGIITPWFLLLIPPKVVNFYDLLLEYILVMYIFIPIGWFDNIIKINNQKKFPKDVIFASFITILFLIKLIIHVWAGYLFYTKNNWIASLFINAEIIGINALFVLPITWITYHIYQSQRKFN